FPLSVQLARVFSSVQSTHLVSLCKHLFLTYAIEMETEELNTDVFIDEIEKRPKIWDMHSKLYSNKTAKKSAWEEMVLMFCKSVGRNLGS
ncbi:unnamed protein product, partial [Callosobruchus maculatus]